MKHVLFLCSQNKLRSPTAEQVFANHPAVEVQSAGTNADAETPLTGELVQWADLIFCMKKNAPHQTAAEIPQGLEDGAGDLPRYS